MTMPIKPTGIARWAYSGSGITEPSVAKQIRGFSGGERPPAAYMNWLLNAHGEQVRYLSYNWVVDDDFSRALDFSQGPTGPFYPHWNVSTPNNGPCGISATGGDALGGMGVALIGGVSGPSGVHQLSQNPGLILSRDFVFEAVACLRSRGNSMTARIGLGQTLPCFWATGLSGNWQFQWTPSGMGKTGLDTGVDAFSPSRFQTFCVERIGATMVVQINGADITIQPANESMGTALVGVRLQNENVASGSASIAVDRIRFGIKR